MSHNDSAALRFLCLKFSYQQGCVVSAEAQGIGDCAVHIHLYALALAVIQITLRIILLKACGCVNITLLNGLDTGDEFHAACST